ncbi:MAG: DUF2807 domain-containing protein [Bacteroidetes bacterium]|nr:DUF2807 domain-containing protein [Bacteroidota bacterium]MDA1224107.1 DUF2807 domain-containing protein [Bacteroidota bacterium]
MKPTQTQKNHWSVFIFALFFIQFFSACQNSVQPWESFGDITSETRTLGSFHGLDVNQDIELFITQDSTKPAHVEITYGKNVIPGITTEITNGVLSIKNSNKAKWLRKLNIQPKCTLNLHQIDNIHLEGNAKVICIDTLYSQAIHCTVNSVEDQNLLVFCGQFYGGVMNSSNVKLSGQATIFSWSCEKGGGLDATDLRSDDVYLYHFTIKDVFVNPSKQFDAHLFNSGNAYYFATPTYKFKESARGTGQVKLKKP